MIIKIDAIQSYYDQICKYLIILTILLVSSALPAMENLVNILKIAEESDPIYKEA